MESIYIVFFTEGLAVSGGHPGVAALLGEKEGELAPAATGMSGVQTKIWKETHGRKISFSALVHIRKNGSKTKVSGSVAGDRCGYFCRSDDEINSNSRN